MDISVVQIDNQYYKKNDGTVICHCKNAWLKQP